MRQNNKKPLFTRPVSSGLGKIPPQALELEQVVIGAMLIEKNATHQVISLLKADDFYHEKHQRIYAAILELINESEPVDILTVSQKLRKTGQIEFVGGASYVTELTSRVNSAANIESHCRIIAEMSLKRQLISLISEVEGKCFDDTEDAFRCKEILDTGLSLITGNINSGKTRTMKDIVAENLKQIATAMGIPDGITGVPSGFTGIDKITAGWQNSDLIVIAARPGVGKALPLTANVLTINGWKLMGDLTTNDKVAGRDGEFYNITGVYPQGKKQMYKVVFEEGASVLCCKEHLWFTETRANRRSSKKPKPSGSVKSTIDIINSLRTGSDGRLNHCIPYCDPIKFNKKYLPIDPYLLGVLIGDGSTVKSILVSNPEKDIICRVKNSLPIGDYLSEGKDGLNHRINGGVTRELLRSMDLYGKRSYEKFIPHGYLHSDVDDRIKLLNGLIDTDGYVTKGNCCLEYSTTSYRLALDIKFLVQSLGGRCTYKRLVGKYKKNGKYFICRDYYRMIFSFDAPINPAWSSKHSAKFKAKRKPHKRFIADIIPMNIEVDCQCISVDSPDNLYITDNFVVTHNTAFVVSSALNSAIRFNMPGVIFSLEMSATQLGLRMMASELDFMDLSTDKLRRGKITEDAYDQINKHISSLINCKIYIDDTPALSISSLKSKAHDLKRKYGIKWVIVDYLQLVTCSEKGILREQQVSKVSSGLKALAKELNLPVIALSQLSRSVETRGGDKRPQQSDLRESGAIEQDADLIAFLYRPEYYGISEDANGFPTAGVGEFIISKHRNGPIEDIILKFVGKRTKFYNPGEDAEPSSVQNFKPLPRTPYNDFDSSGPKLASKDEDDIVPF
jgi:replicative DNA helicase